jgi:hypothetical protein
VIDGVDHLAGHSPQPRGIQDDVLPGEPEYGPADADEFVVAPAVVTEGSARAVMFEAVCL